MVVWVFLNRLGRGGIESLKRHYDYDWKEKEMPEMRSEVYVCLRRRFVIGIDDRKVGKRARDCLSRGVRLQIGGCCFQERRQRNPATG
jgi:hypothetical protein